MIMDNLVLYETIERVGYLTLNRPDKRNALSPELVHALMAALQRAEADPGVKVVILRANGDSFCSGADLAHLQRLQHFSEEENLADSHQLRDLFLKIYQLPKVVIAQVQGHALAGGCGIASVCDFVFATPEAKMGYTEVRIGFIPAMVLVFLIRKIGEQKAKQLLLSGDLVQGEEARRLGLVNFVEPADEIADKTFDFAQRIISQNSSESMAATKKLIDEVQSLSLAAALDLAATRNAQARASDDCKRGIDAFLRKEKLSW